MHAAPSFFAVAGGRERLRGLLRERAEMLVLVGLVVLALGLKLTSDKTFPAGVFGLGVVNGAAVALQAIGVVLVYRSNRIINFAQVPIGLAGAAVFFELVRWKTLLLGVHAVCPTCIELDSVSFGPDRSKAVPVNVPGWLEQANFWLAVLIALALVALMSWLTYTLVIRRFAQSSRLIATVATIGMAEIFTMIQTSVPGWFNVPVRATGTVRVPLDWEFRFAGVNFAASSILTVLVAGAALVLLTLFFTRTSMGIVLRGASENPQRAETLGVNITSISSLVWITAGCLSAIAGMIAAIGTGVGASAGTERLLAVAAVAGFVSIPITVAGGLALGMADQAVNWVTGSSAPVDALVLVMIVTVFMVQRTRGTRVDTEADAGWKAARETRPIPAELRKLEVVQRWLRTGRILGGAAVLGLPWLLSPSQTNLAAVALIYGIVALSLLVLTGWAGQISLGHFAFAAIGAWITAVLDFPFPIAPLVGGVVGAAAAVVIGLPALRLRGLHLAVSTIAFAVATTSILVNPRYLGKHLPATLARPKLLGLALEDQRTFYYFVLFFLALTAVAVMGLRRSRTARALIGARDNEAAAQAFGINLVRARLGAFAVSGFLAAFAGGMFAYSQYAVNVQSFTADVSVRMFLMVVIGGLGSVAGPLLGAAYVGAVDMFRGGNQLIATGATGIGVVALLLFLPGGLGDLVFRMRDAMLRRVAARYRIDVPSLVADRHRDLGQRVPIAPRQRSGGGTVFTPRRYRPTGQWGVEAHARKEGARV